MGDSRQRTLTDVQLYKAGFFAAYQGSIVDIRYDGLPVYMAGWWWGSVVRSLVVGGMLEVSDVPRAMEREIRRKKL